MNEQEKYDLTVKAADLIYRVFEERKKRTLKYSKKLFSYYRLLSLPFPRHLWNIRGY